MDKLSTGRRSCYTRRWPLAATCATIRRLFKGHLKTWLTFQQSKRTSFRSQEEFRASLAVAWWGTLWDVFDARITINVTLIAAIFGQLCTLERPSVKLWPLSKLLNYHIYPNLLLFWRLSLHHSCQSEQDAFAKYQSNYGHYLYGVKCEIVLIICIFAL